MGVAAVSDRLDSLLDTIAELDDDDDDGPWPDAARWRSAEGWVDHDDGTDDGPWFMDHDEDHPPPVVTAEGVRWL